MIFVRQANCNVSVPKASFVRGLSKINRSRIYVISEQKYIFVKST